MSLRVLLSAANGPVAHAWRESAPKWAQIHAAGSAELDVFDDAVVGQIMTSFEPEMLINASAYTVLDKAEQDPERAIVDVPTGMFPTPARRPLWSVLECGRLQAAQAITQPIWHEDLLQVVRRLPDERVA